MNKDLLPIKYQIGVWKTLPSYPTREDVLYEVAVYVSKMKGDEFSESTLNGIWFDQSGVANWKGTKHENIVNDLMKDGTFEISKTDKSGKVWYKITNNPWTV